MSAQLASSRVPVRVGAGTTPSALVTVVVLGACAVLAAVARAETTATMASVLHPNRLGARAAVGLKVEFAAPHASLPAPVRRVILRFPAGLTLEIPHLRSCSGSLLRAHGARGCPALSLLGRGHALAAAYLGSQTLAESVELSLFLGPLRNLQPTVELLGRGFTPFDKRVVLEGEVLTDSAPYGERLALSIPPVTTLPLEPDASIRTLSLTVGTVARGGQEANTVRIPRTCPLGGFPVAGEFAYADGSSGTARTAIACP